MNKKLIRLTEGDLHKIVKESVDRVLTELDWKTYANAEREANKRSRGERPLSAAMDRRMSDPEKHYKAWNDVTYANRKFRDAKIDAFNKQYGGDAEMKKRDGFNDIDYLETGVGPYFPNGYSHSDASKNDSRYKPSFFYTDAEKRASDDAIRATDEFSDYLTGNYDYQKGNGWQLKK